MIFSIFADYVEGGSLQDWIDNRRIYEGGSQEVLKRILDIAIQMAWGLHYAHEQGLIHQDETSQCAGDAGWNNQDHRLWISQGKRGGGRECPSGQTAQHHGDV